MIKAQHPYVDDNGTSHENKIKFYSDQNFQIIQKETGKIFDFAIDTYPSKYSYNETGVVVEDCSVATTRTAATESPSLA